MKLNRRNAAALHLYAELVGVSSQEFLNRFLVEFLIAHFGDPQIGAAEPFLGSFEFKDREKAERIAQWVKEHNPDLEIETLKLPRSRFKVRATYMFDGRMHEICG